MEVMWFKILSLLLIFAAGLFAGVAPTRICLTDRGKRQLILGNAFAGGIFLGAGLLHMLPDAFDNFKAFAGSTDFPFPALICGAGFLSILLLEKTILGGKEEAATITEGRSAYPFILCFILSIHSIIAGTSLGLEAALSSAAAIFIAIIAHKGAASFALGVSLKENHFPTSRHILIICFFSAMTPLGVVFGTIFSKLLSTNASAGFEAIFDALAAGTFLYVAVVDIIEEVFQEQHDRWNKTLLILCGFALMAVVAIWT